MKGLATKEDELNHIMVRCREPSLMGAIKMAYVDLYQKNLESRIKGEVSSDYEKLLVAIVDRGKAVMKKANAPIPFDQNKAVAEAERAEADNCLQRRGSRSDTKRQHALY